MATSKHKITHQHPSAKVLDNTTVSPDQNLEINADILDRIGKLMKFFDETGISYDKYDPSLTPKLDLDEKKAYPNNDHFVAIPGAHDTQKWLTAVRDIYYKEKNGLSRKDAVRQATTGWRLTETSDFLNWLKFYEEGTHLKYKYAQVWYENGTPGYFLHIKKDEPKNNSAISGQDVDSARDAISTDLSSAEKKQIIEKQRHKIIGRLDSAEKLLRSQDGQLFAGKELESLLESIYQLKKKLQMINKISMSTRTYDDLIIREANILTKRGFYRAGQALYSLSQGQIPIATPPAPPNQGSGSVGGLPSTGPGMPQTPPESADNATTPNLGGEPSKGISKFLENLDTSGISTLEDTQESEDKLEVTDELDISDTNDEIMVSEAQDLSTSTIPAESVELPPDVPQATIPQSELSKSIEHDIKKELQQTTSTTHKDFDNMIDAAFSNLGVEDVVYKLEDLAKIFKTREVPRQLAIVDMMLDSLGLASYFPSLSEATNKALESNNYISTRIEDILSKLRGSMKTRDLDLRGEEGNKPSPEVELLKKNLKKQEEKEKAKKEMRKRQEEKEMEALETSVKETPEIEIEEDLSQSIPPLPPAPLPPKPTRLGV